MKKFFSFLLILSVALCLIALGGCAEKEASMQEGEITIRGMIGGKTAINPAFDWENPKNDPSFFVVLTKEGDDDRLEERVTEAHFELSESLDAGAKYRLSIKGEKSGTSAAVSFETAESESVSPLSAASISLCDPYASHMVLQRGRAITIEGKTRANTLVTAEFLGARHYAISDGEGAFSLSLPPQEKNKIPSDFELRLLKEKKLVLQDVLVGDVYLVSGQSNIQRTVLQSDCAEEDVSEAIRHDVRFFKMDLENTASEPLDKVKGGEWFRVSEKGKEYENYSAISFMLGSMLGKALSEKGVPVGIVCATKGNTNIASWIGKDYYDGDLAYKNVHYNAKIYPLKNAEFTGVVWYQGCNNAAAGISYKGLLTALLANWRALFKKSDLPFYIVQLPVYDGDSGNPYDFSFVRESQFKVAEEDENAYLIATCDDGDPADIHPVHKRYIAERLSKSVLSTVYGENYLPQGPTYLSHSVNGNEVTILVKNGDGLTSNGEAIRGFLLAGEDGKYYEAAASVQGETIVVSSDLVSEPKYIKYGFSKSPFLNLYNKDGFLMSPFRTDEYNRNIDLLDYSENASYNRHPDGSEMSYRAINVSGERGLLISKADDGKDFGSISLPKYGAIGFEEWGVSFRLVGSGSGASVFFRIVEGSGEIWAYEIKDDFTGEKEITASTLDLICVYNKKDGIIDYQKVASVEVMIRAPRAASVTVLGFRFVDVPRTAPTAFSIEEARNDGHECVVRFSQSAFTTLYRVIVSEDGAHFAYPVWEGETNRNEISFDASILRDGTPYFVHVVASNELGETEAENGGFEIGGVDRHTIQTFAFKSESALQSFVKKNMAVHGNLELSRAENAVKIAIREKGDWLYCIVNTEQGIFAGYDSLRFYMDLGSYKGSGAIVQLHGANGEYYSFDLNSVSKKEGYFEIPLSSFKRSGISYGGESVTRVAFNFIDYVGGENDFLLLSDLELLKG